MIKVGTKLNTNSNKKPLLSEALAGKDNKGLQSADADQHRDRIARFASLKHRAKKQEKYLWTLFTPGNPSDESQLAVKSAQKLSECGNYLLFKNYFTVGEIRLSKMQTCQQHLLCPFCAALRASKSMQKYMDRIIQVMKENKKLKPVMITFTVKNGADLKERFYHLMGSFRTLLDRRRDYLKKGRGWSEFCKIEGALYSYENTKNQKTGEWHPHIHMFALIEDWIDQEEFAEYWYNLTGDSIIVDIRRVKPKKGMKKFEALQEAISEVCKYALKFGDLSVQDTWQAFNVLKGKRLTGSFGLLWGVKIPENLADEMPYDQDLPYLEMLYKFVSGKQSYYDLASTRHVEPQANIERMSEDERSDRPTRHERNIASGESVGVDGVAYPVRTSPRHARQKKHWQISPVTRVRVRQRIRKWDGYLYNIDLFLYVERRLLAFIKA